MVPRQCGQIRPRCHNVLLPDRATLGQRTPDHQQAVLAFLTSACHFLTRLCKSSLGHASALAASAFFCMEK